MKLGLIGFGKTGRAVASVLMKQDDFELAWVVRRSAKLEHRSLNDILDIETNNRASVHSLAHISYEDLLYNEPVDIIIDFSSDESISQYGEAAANYGVRIISAVSHYPEEQIEYIQKISKKTVVFWSPNITLGINYLIFAAKFLQKIAPNVDIEIVEEHFKNKAGISGTALKMAEELNLKKSEISSIRAGGIVGRHQVIFGFKYQTIRLTHESISREAFGNGVLFVARNLGEKKPGLYNYDDIMQDLLIL